MCFSRYFRLSLVQVAGAHQDKKGENSRKGALTGDMGSTLVSLSWWDWDEEKIRSSLPAIMSGELDALLNRK